MNRIKSLTLSLLAVVAMVSCSNQGDVTIKNETLVLKVSMPEGFQSKVSLGNLSGGSAPQFWNTGDCIAVVKGRGTSSMTYSVYRLIGDGGTAEAEFEYVSGNAGLDGEIDVVYPVSAAAKESAVPHSQEYTAGGYDPESVVLSWHGESGVPAGETITLANESAVLCLQYTGVETQKVSLVRVKIRLSDGTYDTYVLSKRSGVALSSSPSSFFISVPEVSEGSEVIFETVLTDQSVMRMTSQNKTFKSGVIYRFAPVPFVANVVPEEGYDVYLCIGQSNMAGRGEILAEDNGIMDGIYLLDGTGTPVPAKVPFNIYSTVRKKMSMQKFGLHNVFADEIYKFTGRKTLLVLNARGGTSIVSWLKGAETLVRSEEYSDDESLWGQEIPRLYDEAVRRALQAMEFGQLKGILWHQGEGDSSDDEALQYVDRLKLLVADLRNDLGVDENVPFVMGHVSLALRKAPVINPQLTRAAEEIPNAFCTSSQGCEIQNDNTHFKRSGYIVMGKRYSAFILKEVYGIKVD